MACCTSSGTASRLFLVTLPASDSVAKVDPACPAARVGSRVDGFGSSEALAEDPASIVHFGPTHILDKAISTPFVHCDEVMCMLRCVERELGDAFITRALLDDLDQARTNAATLLDG